MFWPPSRDFSSFIISPPHSHPHLAQIPRSLPLSSNHDVLSAPMSTMSWFNHAFNAAFASASNGPDTVEDHKPKMPGTFPSSPPSSPANVSVAGIACLLIPRHLFLSQTKSKRPLSPDNESPQPGPKRQKTGERDVPESTLSDDDAAGCFYDVS